MISKNICLKKMEALFFMLRMQSKLIALLDIKDELMFKAEQNYEEVKDQFFQVKALLNNTLIGTSDLQGLYVQIQLCMSRLTADRVQLLRCIPYGFDKKLIPLIEKLFSDLDSACTIKVIDESLCKSNLNKLIDSLSIKSSNLCEMKHRLLFFELKSLSTQTAILNYLGKLFLNNEKDLFDLYIEKSQEQLALAKQCYMSVDDFLAQNKRQGLLLIDEKLEEQLAVLYGQRIITQKKLRSLINTAIDKLNAQQGNRLALQKMRAIQQLLATVEVLLDRISSLVNYAEDVPDNIRLDFLSLLKQVEQDTKEFCLEYFYADRFPVVYRAQTIVLLQNKWQSILQNSVDELNKQYPNKASISYVMAVKQLLGEYKNYHYVSICETLTHSQVLDGLFQLFQNNSDPSVSAVMRTLQQQRHMLQFAIKTIETSLSNYSHTLGFSASFVRLLKNNWYYRIAESYIKSSHEITLSESLRNVPIVGKKLSDSQLKILTGVQTTVFIATEIAIAQSIGISYSLLASLIEYVMPDINVLIRIAKRISLDEIDTINSLATIKWFTGLHVQLLLHVMMTKNTDNLMLPIGSYVTSSLVRNLTTQLITYAVSRPKNNIQSSASFEFGKFLAESGAHFLGRWIWLSMYPSLDAFLTKPSEQDLLHDPILCKQYTEQCQAIALKTLQLNKKEVSPKDIKEQFRKLALQHHPDKNHDKNYGRYVGSFFEDIRHAKQRALECAAHDATYSVAAPVAKR